MRLRVSRVAILAGCTLLAACSSTPRRPTSPSLFNDAGLRGQLRLLSSARFAGRRPGTPGGTAVVDYLVAQLRLFGLKPGNGTSYLQQVPLVEVKDKAVQFSVLRAGVPPASLAPTTDIVVWTTSGDGVGTLDKSPVVFVGYGVDAPRDHWNDYTGIDVRGKTVIILAGVPAALGDAAAAARFSLPRYKFEEAARHGAAGVLLVDAANAAHVPWRAIVDRAAGGVMRAPAAKGKHGSVQIQGWIRRAAAARLFADAGSDYAAAVARAGRVGFRATPLGLRADAVIRAEVRRFDSPNVVAILPGRHRRHEYIVYTAHWDGLGRIGGGKGGATLPGAIDNASGVSGLLILAQAFARARERPERSMVFLATTAGEYGSLGARYYVNHPLYPLRETVADIDLEMLHIGGPTRDVASLARGESQLDRYLANAAQLQGRVVRGDPDPSLDLFRRSDAQRFATHGVPPLYAVGGMDDAAEGPAWGKARLRDYFAKRYRQVGDAYSSSWDLRGTLQDLRLYFEVGMRLARTPLFPNWNPGSVYRRLVRTDGG